MDSEKLGLLSAAVLLIAFASCDGDDEIPPAAALAGTAGVAGTANSGGAGGNAQAGDAGSVAGGGKGAVGGGGAMSDPLAGADAGGVGGSSEASAECGDPRKDGVVIYQDIVSETTWACPVYTLTQPIYVHSSSDEPVVLHIEPGVTVRGVKGAEPVKLPGALIVTRSGRLDAVGTKERPIVFTTSLPAAERAPGSWGGLMLLGRAPVNAPENFETSGKPAGEAYAEALARTELGLYGWSGGGDGEGGAGGNGAGGAGGAGGASGASGESADYSSWSCGTLKYARIDFAGFKAGSSKELNGLTLGGCGSDTVVEHVQVHRSSDDGVEIFGGSVNLSHIVLTGNQDDALDWDQGWRGKAQFVAVQTHDDADSGDSCGIEADGYATPDAPVGLPSAPRISNLTLILSKNTQRGIRFRDGTQAFVQNAILAAHAAGVPKGLIDIDHVLTADYLAKDKLLVEHSIFRGIWPTSGQADSRGTTYLEQDHFTGSGDGATGNDVIAAASELWLNAFNTAAPEWVPAASSAASTGAATPSNIDGEDFFDESAAYRGAFEPGGDDWTAGWTKYE
jgi:hypothetical protein